MDDPAISEAQRVRELIVLRRSQARERQELEAEENMARAGLCTDNRKYKAAIPGLEAKIRALEASTPALYAYIRKMELAEFSRVCADARVDVPAVLAVAAAQPVAAPCRRAEVEDVLANAIKSLQAALDTMSPRVSTRHDAMSHGDDSPPPLSWTGIKRPPAASRADIALPLPAVAQPREDFSEKITSLAADAGDLW